MKRYVPVVVLWPSYILLSLIKFFTGVVVGIGDSTTSLVIKIYPTMGNYWTIGEETTANILKHQGTWYFDKKYWLLTANENGFAGEMVYMLMILAWWVFTIILAIRFLRKLILQFRETV